MSPSAERAAGPTATARAAEPPLVLHVVYRFDTGGLENGVVNLIDALPADRFRHAVLAIESVSPTFAARIRRPGVECLALDKPPGHAVALYPRVWQLLRRMRPAIVHTRNLAALEMQLPAALAGVPVRIHGEHGRDMHDLHGDSVRHQRLRRAYRPFVHQYVALSRDLQDYLTDRVGVPHRRVAQIYNGVDTARFRPRGPADPLPDGFPFGGDRERVVVGTVGRLQPVKAQAVLARAFVDVLRRRPALRGRLRLAIAGDGPSRAEVQAVLDDGGVAECAWFAGDRGDVPALMRAFDVFVLPSLAEGISNTMLEAMASAVPVVATVVGGNADLLDDGAAGRLVPANDPAAIADALLALVDDRAAAAAIGAAGRRRVERHFSLDAMAGAYRRLYETQIAARGR